MKAVLLGSGELGKEVAIELARLGVDVVAVDRYAGAPAMHVTPFHKIIDMTDADAIRYLLIEEEPDLVIPEIEAIATSVLVDLERDFPVVPSARAVHLTMNREGIRRLVAEELQLPTSPYCFVDSPEEMREAARSIGLPCVVKPVMSSSGKGQSVLRDMNQVDEAWRYALEGARGKSVRCIVEGFVNFDAEITLLTVQHSGGITFFDPIYHLQIDGDYAESWMDLPGETIEQAQDLAQKVVKALGGWGLFGVELFLVGDEVIFSEVSPRPHDTGLVTMAAGDISEFAAHARAVLGIPVPPPQRFPQAVASVPIKVRGKGRPILTGLDEACRVDSSVQVRDFGKPYVDGERRIAVVVARGASSEDARRLAHRAASKIDVMLVD
ncbi:formate-dependent phosphoribosylglycinamide formyltransferase [Actinomycetaceae bacterium WB03_NA08]|uniref:Formate-dependent phosphoribosylglycinamide formyltransferase n=1 Tax=Scrofimicrobium canadense TaxID=2652290 RepID=A0A6N7W5Q3_9ACTO|nr:formate-dependent phosphoribosylglycinamide formyltransferase [Scrofimicrobium canadense]MSS84731.1 formate-dependent phosphoribosylglycinamide formyltransferase [Scrofimicrobium canadense]